VQEEPRNKQYHIAFRKFGFRINFYIVQIDCQAKSAKSYTLFRENHTPQYSDKGGEYFLRGKKKASILPVGW